MPRMEFPRNRGGRSPQIGPGTFEGRSEPAGPGPYATQWTALAWSAGAMSPDVELWCLYLPQSSDHFHRVTDETRLHLARAPASAQFEASAPPDSPATAVAFRDFAMARYLLEFSIPPNPSDWRVQTSTPLPALGVGPNDKLAPGLYAISQEDRFDGALPLAWVDAGSTPELGEHEIWLLWRPGQPDGFLHPGTQPEWMTEPYSATELLFSQRPAPANFPNEPTDLVERVARLRAVAIESPGSPVTDPLELVVHHFRVQSNAL